MTAVKYSSQFLALLKEKSFEIASKFPDYNFRKYFQRITEEDFQILSKMNASDEKFVPFVQKLVERRNMMERQVTVQSLYQSRTSFMDDPERDMETYSPASRKSVDEEETV